MIVSVSGLTVEWFISDEPKGEKIFEKEEMDEAVEFAKKKLKAGYSVGIIWGGDEEYNKDYEVNFDQVPDDPASNIASEQFNGA